MQYQERFGRRRRRPSRKNSGRAGNKSRRTTHPEIDWFPSWKKSQILEDLLAKTYQDLIAEMEREGLS